MDKPQEGTEYTLSGLARIYVAESRVLKRSHSVAGLRNLTYQEAPLLTLETRRRAERLKNNDGQ